MPPNFLLKTGHFKHYIVAAMEIRFYPQQYPLPVLVVDTFFLLLFLVVVVVVVTYLVKSQPEVGAYWESSQISS